MLNCCHLCFNYKLRQVVDGGGAVAKQAGVASRRRDQQQWLSQLKCVLSHSENIPQLCPFLQTLLCQCVSLFIQDFSRFCDTLNEIPKFFKLLYYIISNLIFFQLVFLYKFWN